MNLTPICPGVRASQAVLTSKVSHTLMVAQRARRVADHCGLKREDLVREAVGTYRSSGNHYEAGRLLHAVRDTARRDGDTPPRSA